MSTASGGGARETFDDVVIGAGSAGAVVAARLSEDPRRQVLLLEAGGSNRSPVISMPAATDLYGIGNPKFDWRYLTEPDPSRGGRTDLWPRGKGLGGSSAINSMIYMRGNAGDYDSWAALGNPGWSYADVLPYFKRAERNENGADHWRGGEGPLRVSNARTMHPLALDFIAAAEAAGIPYNRDVNGGRQEGVGPIQATQTTFGRRHSTADAYLRPARRRANLAVRTRALATRILVEDGAAVGVEYQRPDGSQHAVAARRTVVLSAGAIASPQLLMLSGIGPAAHLRALGLDVLLDLPGVGRNLQEHPALYLNYEVDQPTYNALQGPLSQLWHGLDWLIRGRGPGTTPGALAMAFVRSDPGLPYPDLQLHFTPIGYELTPEALIVMKEQVVTVIPNVNRPFSRGWLELATRNPHEPPRIHCRLLEDERDLETLLAGVNILRRICATAPFADHVLREMAPGPDLRTEADLAAYARANCITTFHPCGTCRMGSDGLAVVDHRLRLRGIDRLSVVDASIMPHEVSGNLNAPVVMIGEKGADLLREAGRSA